MARNDEQQLVAVDDRAAAIDHHDAVAVAVERDAEICAPREHFAPQEFRMRRTAPVVDVETVRFGTNDNDVGAEFGEYARRHVVRRAVRAIDDDLAAAQTQTPIDRGLAELDVATTGIVDAPHLAELLGRYTRKRRSELRFDF